MTPSEKLARDAVTTLEVVSKNAWAMSNLKHLWSVEHWHHGRWEGI